MASICSHCCHPKEPSQTLMEVLSAHAGSSVIRYGFYSGYLQENYKLLFELFDKLNRKSKYRSIKALFAIRSRKETKTKKPRTKTCYCLPFTRFPAGK